MSREEVKSIDKLIKTCNRLNNRVITWRAQRGYKTRADIYKPLDQSVKEIRILEVEPGQRDDILRCTLKQVSLQDEWIPVYETISYCWGPPRKPSVVRVNGHWLFVPPSAEAAVRRMRYPDRERTLWIDAICINQSSLSERSQQVAMMSEIYKAGERNLVYLGEDHEHMAEGAADSVHALATELRSGTNNFARLYPTLYDTDTGTHLHSEIGFESDLDVEALELLFDLPWFSRLWVLQEIKMARSNTCHWGEVTFQLLEVMRAARWIAFKRDFMCDTVLDTPGWFCACIMYEMRDPVIESLGLEPAYLGDLLYTLRLCQTTEPRDSIYGLLGLLSDKHTLPEVWQWMLEVDYTKSVADVMCDATRYALAEAGDMRAIQLSSYPRSTSSSVRDFPSWAVRAHLQPEPDTAVRLPHLFSADQGLEAPSLFGDMRPGYDILQGQGFVADHVLATTDECSDKKTIKGLYFWLTSVKDIVKRFCSRQHEGVEVLVYTDVALTLIASQSKSGRRAQPSDVTILVQYLLSLPLLPGDDEEADRVFAAVSVDDRKALDDMISLLYCMHRRFFVTEKGFMGIGPAEMEIGDSVVVLRGARLPFILRRQEHYYHVGSAYVHGIMYGEAVKEWQSREEEELLFAIR